MKKHTVSAITAGIFLSLIGPLMVSAATAPVLKTPTATCVSGKPQITITWNSTNAQSYTVFRLEQPQTQWLTRYSLVRGTTQKDKYVKNATTYQYQVRANAATGSASSNIVTVKTPDCSSGTTTAQTPPPVTQPTTPSPTPNPVPTPTPAPSNNEKTFSAYITGYGWPDNTPPSAEISNPVIHSLAGGTGTFTDPITIAVGHSITSGKDTLDYPAGTKFYIPALQRYFITEDTCGDGNAPQNGPCHTGFQGKPWLDAWVGGTLAQTAATLACEDKITGIHTVIQDPAANYVVSAGAVFNGSCSPLFSEAPTTN